MPLPLLLPFRVPFHFSVPAAVEVVVIVGVDVAVAGGRWLGVAAIFKQDLAVQPCQRPKLDSMVGQLPDRVIHLGLDHAGIQFGHKGL